MLSLCLFLRNIWPKVGNPNCELNKLSHVTSFSVLASKAAPQLSQPSWLQGSQVGAVKRPLSDKELIDSAKGADQPQARQAQPASQEHSQVLMPDSTANSTTDH